MRDKLSLSVVCGVKDRPYEQALASWLARPEVGEVVLVDWSSEILKVESYDPRVVVARALGQDRWVASKCHNLGLQLARGTHVLRLDADDILHEDFFLKHQAPGDFFYYAELERARDDNETHLAGVVYARREDFFAVGCYNERIGVYGYEDTDLVVRMSGSLRPVPLDFTSLHHVPHGDDKRYENQRDEDFEELEERLVGAQPWSYRLLGKGDRAIMGNKILAERDPWTSLDRMTEWVVTVQDGPVRYLCEEVR